MATGGERLHHDACAKIKMAFDKFEEQEG